MIEIPVLYFALIIEFIVLLLGIILLWVYLTGKSKNRDRNAAKQLAEQIKHQSDTRLKETGSFLQEKYNFEGNQLKKAVEAIDKAEKQFFQNIITLYLQRDADALSTLDAKVAEMIDTYKSLKPSIPEPVVNAESVENAQDTEKDAEIERLREANAKLSDELAITNKTMSDMIGEFGNMFGGGHDSSLEKDQVVEKVIAKKDTKNDEQGIEEEIEVDVGDDDDIAIETDMEEVTSDDDIDDILNGVSPSKE
jgi:hypothetical protein